jgi:predicted O-methyltransferase YrrM
MTRAKRWLLTLSLPSPIAVAAMAIRSPVRAKAWMGRVRESFLDAYWDDSSAPVVDLRELLTATDAGSVRVPILPSGDETEWAASPWCAAAVPGELLALGALARALRPRLVFEIGTFRGASALAFALNAPADGEVHTLDLPPEVPPEAIAAADRHDLTFRLLRERGEARAVGAVLSDWSGPPVVHQHFGDSTAFDFGPWAGRVDLFFIDGGHHREAVIWDTRTAMRAVRLGGVIVWHDYRREVPGVAAALSELRAPVVRIEGTSLAVGRVEAGDRLKAVDTVVEGIRGWLAG